MNCDISFHFAFAKLWRVSKYDLLEVVNLLNKLFLSEYNLQTTQFVIELGPSLYGAVAGVGSAGCAGRPRDGGVGRAVEAGVP